MVSTEHLWIVFRYAIHPLGIRSGAFTTEPFVGELTVYCTLSEKTLNFYHLRLIGLPIQAGLGCL